MGWDMGWDMVNVYVVVSARHRSFTAGLGMLTLNVICICSIPVILGLTNFDLKRCTVNGVGQFNANLTSPIAN